jgi:hypothetical protein
MNIRNKSGKRPPLLKKSQHIPKVSDFLTEKEENTIRKSKKVKRKIKNNSRKVSKGEEELSRIINNPLNDKVLKMFLERQKEYRGRLENLEKKTDSSHQMLEDLSGLGESMKSCLDQIPNDNDGQHILRLEMILDKFERLSTDLKESQVLQKYWLDNLKLSSSKLESVVRRELMGNQSRYSEFFNNPQSITSRTFQSYADPLNSESNSLFQKKLIGQSIKSKSKSKNYPVVGSQRFNRNYKKKATHRLSQENNKMPKEDQLKNMYKKMSTENNMVHPKDHFLRRKTAQTHEIRRDSSKETKAKESKETVPSRRVYKKTNKREVKEPGKESEDTEHAYKQNHERRKKNIKEMSRPGSKASRKVIKLRNDQKYFLSKTAKLDKNDLNQSRENSFQKELKKSQSNQFISKNPNLGQINIYHTSSKHKLNGTPNNHSLPYLHVQRGKDNDFNERVNYSENKSFQNERQNVPFSIEFQMDKKSGYQMMTPTQKNKNMSKKALQNITSPHVMDRSEDFVIEPIQQSKKSLRVKKDHVSSREEIIQLNHEFIKKNLGHNIIPSQIVPSEVSETESGYETNIANYETTSTVQSEEPHKGQNVVINQPISQMMSSWEPKIDYTQGRPVGNIIYNPHMMQPQGNFHMYPSNHSLPPQFPFYNNSNLYQKAQMIPAYDSNYNHNYNHQPPVQNNYRPISHKNKRKKKRKKKNYQTGGTQKFDQLNKLNQKILKKRAKKRKTNNLSGNYSEDFSHMSGNHSSLSGNLQNVSSPMMPYNNTSEHGQDSHYNSHYYYPKHKQNPHMNY